MYSMGYILSMIELRETAAFLEFMEDLRDRRAKVKIAGRVDRYSLRRRQIFAGSRYKIGQAIGKGVRAMNAKLKTTPFDAANYLDSAEAIAIYLEDAFETDDPAYIAHALGTIARAKGMTEVARKTGLSRESLYKALSVEGNPEFATILKVMSALDLKISARPSS